MKIRLLRGVMVEGKAANAGTILETVNGPWARTLIARGWAEEVTDAEADAVTEGGDVPPVIIDTRVVEDADGDGKKDRKRK